MKSFNVSKLRKNLSEVLKNVSSGEVVSIQSRGAEIARIVPTKYNQADARKRLKGLSTKAQIGDILNPVFPLWKSNKW